MKETLERWHKFIDAMQPDPEGLKSLLHPDCVFLSPIVHTPQEGADLTAMYLSAAASVFNDSFHYVKEVVSEPHAVLEFVCEMDDGIVVNGVDIMTFNDEGKITSMKAYWGDTNMRPLMENE